MTGVQKITVGNDEAEQRLDRWVRRRWPHLNQGRIEKMCRRGELRVDGARAKASTRVAPGQVVRVPPIEEQDEGAATEARKAEPPYISDEARAFAETAVLYRDDHIIVLNKPPGLAVQGGSRLHRHLGAFLPALRFGSRDDPRLVHRLDRDTSGVLVLARTGAAAASLGRSFNSRSVEKIYVAAVAGRPDPSAGTIRYGLVKAGGRGVEKMEVLHPDEVARTEGAKSAVTDYRVLEQAGNRVAAVALRPLTGRTHQLRAHMAAIGSPIAGDGKYGGRHQDNPGTGWGAGLGGSLSRKLHLHALQLHFEHPHTSRRVSFIAPLPDHMSHTWATLGWPVDALNDDLFDVP